MITGASDASPAALKALKPKAPRPACYLLLCLLPCALGAVDGDAGRGEVLASTCAACHGEQGNSTNPVWPKLAGQHADYLLRQLQDFKSGRRDNALMTVPVQALSEQDMADLAVYYSQQPGTTGQSNPQQVALGQRLYRAGNAREGIPACMACHNPAGRGNPHANYPALAGQHAEYTAMQLRYFRAEERSNDDNAVMRNIASRLSNAQIDAVADYVQGLR